MNEDVERPAKVTVNYLDENFVEHEEEFDGICARVFQHEFDHLEGKVYVDRVAPMRKMMLKNKLRNISEGNVYVDYKMIFPAKRRR
jgi:peptide deformylase